MYIQPQYSGYVDYMLQNSGPKGQRSANFAIDSNFLIFLRNNLDHSLYCILFSVICKALCFNLKCSKVGMHFVHVNKESTWT